MIKPLVLCSCPIDTVSGYGGRSRDLMKALIKLKGTEWDIKIISQRWGSTPFGALNIDVPEEAEILDRILMRPLDRQPDIYITLSVSDEFQPIGKYNIGMSALVETTILPADMLEGLNRMDLNIVSSNFGKKVAESTTFDRKDSKTGKDLGPVKLGKPVEVLFEGVDTRKFRKLDKSDFDLSDVKEDFCFLSVGHWLSGDMGEDRKQLTTLVKSFLTAFRNKKKRPALLLKTGMAGFSITEEEKMVDILNDIRSTVSGDLPNIYLLFGELTDDEMNQLYNHDKVKAFALVGNEGFGRPYLEFSAASSKPIIASPFSGHMDFLREDFNVFVSGRIEQVHPSAANKFLIKEASWFKADPKSVEDTLKEVYDNYNKYVDMGKRQGHVSRTEYNLDKMTERLAEILAKNIPKISIPQAISLPKLKTK